MSKVTEAREQKANSGNGKWANWLEVHVGGEGAVGGREGWRVGY